MGGVCSEIQELWNLGIRAFPGGRRGGLSLREGGKRGLGLSGCVRERIFALKSAGARACIRFYPFSQLEIKTV